MRCISTFYRSAQRRRQACSIPPEWMLNLNGRAAQSRAEYSRCNQKYVQTCLLVMSDVPFDLDFSLQASGKYAQGGTCRHIYRCLRMHSNSFYIAAQSGRQAVNRKRRQRICAGAQWVERQEGACCGLQFHNIAFSVISVFSKKHELHPYINDEDAKRQPYRCGCLTQMTCWCPLSNRA